MPLALKTALWKSLLSTLWFEFPNFQELSTVSPNRWIIPVSSSSALKMILTVFHHHSHWLWFPLFELNPKFGLGCGRKIGNEGWKWRSATMTLLSVFRLCNVKSFPWGVLCTFYSVKSSHASSKTLLSPSGDLGIGLVWENPTPPDRHFSVRLLKSSSKWTKLSMRGPQLFSGWYQMILDVQTRFRVGSD